MIIFHLPPVPPQQLEIKPTFESRLRLERRLDRDFLSSNPDDRTDSLTRFRPGIQWKYGKNWSGEIQFQFAQDSIWQSGQNSGDNFSDLNLASVKFKDSQKEVTFGRQKISLGTERLIGPLEWSLTGRSFDGIRFRSGDWDLFAFKVGVAVPLPKGIRILGAGHSSSLGLTSLIYKHDDQTSPDTEILTLSHWWNRKSGPWVFDVEAAIQSGKAAAKDLMAWAFHGSAAYNLKSGIRSYIEINAASGGGDSENSHTFDNLIPTNHKFYGSMDLQSWRNMEEFVIGVECQFNPKWNFRTSWHKFALRDSRDAWYGANGKPNSGAFGNIVDPTGASGRDVGSELDFELTFKQNNNVSYFAGVGVFSPGHFVKSLNGGSSDLQYWGYFMLQFKL